MILGWVIKVLASLALVGVVGFEIGSPLVTRAQVDEVAHNSADRAAFVLYDTQDPAQARAKAEEVVAVKHGMRLDQFEVRGDRIHVTVSKRAQSILLDRFSPARHWYEVQVSADSTPQRR